MTTSEKSTRVHTQYIREQMTDLRRHLRKDIGEVDDDKAEALFEVTAEVLQGLITAYEHFEGRTEKAWQ
jgi:hypothetical protein